MNQALQRCGFNPATVNYLIDQGFASPSDLMLASESDLDSIARTVGMNQARENKWYPPNIFRLLSQEQKDQLKEWSDKKGKRSVAAMKKQIKDELKNEMKTKGGDDKDSNDEESSADDAAGKEFGRGAHKKKQKKG
ncbi:hypothetical protein MHU86_15271 [Fragilaria crotonensis]|nr:hypothetical protein MHU86_15271 [Fragilaria crotonensis]